MKRNSSFILATLLLAMFFLQGCSDSDDNMSAGAEERSYEVTVLNLSHNQPFSPVAAIMHGAAYQGMTLGASANTALEILAESGDNSGFLADAKADPAVSDTTSGTEVIVSGAQGTMSLTGSETLLTIVSMLVNTNDAITVLNGIELGKMLKDETMTLHARAYDTGTEGNSEAASDIPGPAAGGEGFNAARNDRDFISVHPGIVSMDDGLVSSALSESHRFDNAVAKIMIRRIS